MASTRGTSQARVQPGLSIVAPSRFAEQKLSFQQLFVPRDSPTHLRVRVASLDDDDIEIDLPEYGGLLTVDRGTSLSQLTLENLKDRLKLSEEDVKKIRLLIITGLCDQLPLQAGASSPDEFPFPVILVDSQIGRKLHDVAEGASLGFTIELKLSPQLSLPVKLASSVVVESEPKTSITPLTTQATPGKLSMHSPLKFNLNHLK